jgi:magnesium-transporting ATPase (P-type)
MGKDVGDVGDYRSSPAGRCKWADSAVRQENPRIHELPFDSRRKRMSVIHDDGFIDATGSAGDVADTFGGSANTKRQEIAYIKGAPKEVLSLCSAIIVRGEEREVTDEVRENIISQTDELARAGLRVGDGLPELPRKRN